MLPSIIMTITVNLPEDVLRAARAIADLNGISLGDALVKLARVGLKQTAFPSFEMKDGAKPITLEQALEAEDEL
jgi:hypothetical protein